jgi:hypothetical protein
VTNEFTISKPEIVEEPFSNEPPPIPEPIFGVLEVEVERVLALMREFKIRMKPHVIVPSDPDPLPVPIPEPPASFAQLLNAVTVEFTIVTGPRVDSPL